MSRGTELSHRSYEYKIEVKDSKEADQSVLWMVSLILQQRGRPTY